MLKGLFYFQLEFTERAELFVALKEKVRDMYIWYIYGIYSYFMYIYTHTHIYITNKSKIPLKMCTKEQLLLFATDCITEFMSKRTAQNI